MTSEFGLVNVKPEGKTVNLETGEISDTKPGDRKDDGSRWIELRYDPNELTGDIKVIADNLCEEMESRLNAYCDNEEEIHMIITALANRMIK